MTSPVRSLQTHAPPDSLFDAPIFDGGLENPDFGCFDESLESPHDTYFLNGADYPQPIWANSTKERPGPLIDPYLTGPPTFNPALELSGEMLSPPSEMTPPPSAIDAKTTQWPLRTSGGRNQPVPQLDTSTESHSQFLKHSHNGQITPPLSSKSPESEVIADTTNITRNKRGRKPAAKVATPKVTAAPAAAKSSPTKPSRKARKTQPEPVVEPQPELEGDEEEPSPTTPEAKAKRAKFLERNRQAAFTCRQRKKQWAKDLEDRHRTLERENQNLKMVLGSLRDEFHYLRAQVVSHTTCECSGAREYIQQSSRVLARDCATAINAGIGDAGVSQSENPAGSSAGPPLAGETASLEQALRVSLAQMESKNQQMRVAGIDGLEFVHEGSELDGMTL